MRQFRRRRLAPLMGYRYTRDKESGREMRVETGVEMIEAVDGVVSLLPEWREALERHREETGEIEDNKRQAERFARQSEAYRNRDRTPADKQPSPLRGAEVVAEAIERQREQERLRWIEEQRQKVGMTAATFLADELAGISGARFMELRNRFATHSGTTEELRKAVLYGPWRFERDEYGELYVYWEGADKREYVGPNEKLWRERQPDSRLTDPQPEPPTLATEPRMPPRVVGVYEHKATCDCEWCDSISEPRVSLGPGSAPPSRDGFARSQSRIRGRSVRQGPGPG